ncbi:thioredoxin domain-containing protein [Thiosocius teredinicola]|uniref:hypothetical protein n=1 Tax=Thiosocius teredinicola TaxID=1973002 RepID=UPI000990B0DB
MPSPLIAQLVAEHGYPVLDAQNLASTLESDSTVVLFFTEDPKRYPESNDVAVVLPELARAFPDRFIPMVVDRQLEDQLKLVYDITVWPSLVFLRRGRFLGKISKIRDWSEYMERIPEILDNAPSHNPGVGIPVIDASKEQRHA